MAMQISKPGVMEDETIALASRLDLPAASALLLTLKSTSAKAIVLDMSNVRHMGALCLQVILSAAATVRTEGRTLSLVNTSDQVKDQMRVMGMTPEIISRGCP
jgi:chemotaxis protein CheX